MHRPQTPLYNTSINNKDNVPPTHLSYTSSETQTRLPKPELLQPWTTPSASNTPTSLLLYRHYESHLVHKNTYLAIKRFLLGCIHPHSPVWGCVDSASNSASTRAVSGHGYCLHHACFLGLACLLAFFLACLIDTYIFVLNFFYYRR